MEKSYCTRCGHRLQEFQIILEMHKKNRIFRQLKEKVSAPGEDNNDTDGVLLDFC